MAFHCFRTLFGALCQVDIDAFTYLTEFFFSGRQVGYMPVIYLMFLLCVIYRCH